MARTYSAEEILGAARLCGVTVSLGSIDPVPDPAGGADRYDLVGTIARLGRAESEARSMYDGAMGFQRLNRGGMSAYDASDWEDHADGHLFRAEDAREEALVLARLRRVLEERPEVAPAAYFAQLREWITAIVPERRHVDQVVDLLASALLLDKPADEQLHYLDILVDHYDMQCLDDPRPSLADAFRAARAFVRLRAGLMP